VLALKALCEARLDRDDLRGRIEDALKPARRSERPAAGQAGQPSVEDFRRCAPPARMPCAPASFCAASRWPAFCGLTC
jgi:hypothetical protein